MELGRIGLTGVWQNFLSACCTEILDTLTLFEGTFNGQCNNVKYKVICCKMYIY